VPLARMEATVTFVLLEVIKVVRPAREQLGTRKPVKLVVMGQLVTFVYPGFI